MKNQKLSEEIDEILFIIQSKLFIDRETVEFEFSPSMAGIMFIHQYLRPLAKIINKRKITIECDIIEVNKVFWIKATGRPRDIKHFIKRFSRSDPHPFIDYINVQVEGYSPAARVAQGEGEKDEI